MTPDPVGAALDGALPALRAFLRLDPEDTSEDALLADFLGTGFALAEDFTGQLLLTRDVAETIAATGGWLRLGATPVVAITGADLAGAPLPPGAYEADIDAGGDGWVRLSPGAACSVATIRYRAGLAADWAGLPDPIRQGTLRLAAYLHVNRDRPDDLGPPAAVAALWRPFRRMRLR